MASVSDKPVPAPANGAGPVTRAEFTEALQQQNVTGRIQGAAAVMIAVGLINGLTGGNQQSSGGGGTVAVKLSLGESPMPHEAKGENESGQDFGL
jgi:hypothetical protein